MSAHATTRSTPDPNLPAGSLLLCRRRLSGSLRLSVWHLPGLRRLPFALVVEATGGLPVRDVWLYRSCSAAAAELTLWNPRDEAEPRNWGCHPGTGRVWPG